MKEITKEKLEKYFSITEEAYNIAKVNIGDNKEMAEDFLDMISRYISDARYFYDKGNFSYRQDAFNLAEAIVKEHPWLLGYEKYPERKGNFMEVYRNAPLKNLLRLQIGETELHQ